MEKKYKTISYALLPLHLPLKYAGSVAIITIRAIPSGEENTGCLVIDLLDGGSDDTESWLLLL